MLMSFVYKIEAKPLDPFAVNEFPCIVVLLFHDFFLASMPHLLTLFAYSSFSVENVFSYFSFFVSLPIVLYEIFSL